MGRKTGEEKYFIRMEINSRDNGIKERSTDLEGTLISETTVYSKVSGVKENIAGRKATTNSSPFNFRDI